MIEDLISAYMSFVAVGVITCLTVVGSWTVFKGLASASR